jgi:hypothetical protein
VPTWIVLPLLRVTVPELGSVKTLASAGRMTSPPQTVPAERVAVLPKVIFATSSLGVVPRSVTALVNLTLPDPLPMSTFVKLVPVRMRVPSPLRVLPETVRDATVLGSVKLSPKD